MNRFKKAVSVVTGAAGGIGRCFAVALGHRRGKVVVADKDLDGAAQTAELVRRAQGQALVVPCDVGDPDQLRGLWRATQAWAGTPDLAVFNAGILASGPFASMGAEELDALVRVNVLGVMRGCQVFAGPMIARGRGAILNVASVAGSIPTPGLAAYGATKAAVVGFSQSLHAELRPQGVSVTVLCPSFTRTQLVARGSGSSEGWRQTGQALLDAVGAEPWAVAAAGLEAAARGQLYAIDRLHTRAAWAVARATPGWSSRLAGWVATVASGG